MFVCVELLCIEHEVVAGGADVAAAAAAAGGRAIIFGILIFAFMMCNSVFG